MVTDSLVSLLAQIKDYISLAVMSFRRSQEYHMSLQKVYIASVRQLKRIDSVARSPIYAHFDETIVGVGSIRAYNDEERFIARNDSLVDNSQTCWYNIVIAQR